jgi:hypothetical protein
MNGDNIIRMADERREFIQLEDGFIYWVPTENKGAFAPYILRILAQEIDRRNAPWQKQIDEYFKTHP